MQAIETKYIAPTNHKGIRIKAQCAAKTKIYNWDYGLDVEDNHIKAAALLLAELKWNNVKDLTMNTGCLKSGNYVHVLTNKAGV